MWETWNLLPHKHFHCSRIGHEAYKAFKQETQNQSLLHPANITQWPALSSFKDKLYQWTFFFLKRWKIEADAWKVGVLIKYYNSLQLLFVLSRFMQFSEISGLHSLHQMPLLVLQTCFPKHSTDYKNVRTYSCSLQSTT